jgi:serine/threonine protein kinase
LLKKYAKEILEGLDYIHNMGIIHADIKLANIGLHKENEDSDPIIKIFDFGLSQVMESEYAGKAHLNQAIGTFGYMAPELKGVSRVSKLRID